MFHTTLDNTGTSFRMWHGAEERGGRGGEVAGWPRGILATVKSRQQSNGKRKSKTNLPSREWIDFGEGVVACRGWWWWFTPLGSCRGFLYAEVCCVPRWRARDLINLGQRKSPSTPSFSQTSLQFTITSSCSIANSTINVSTPHIPFPPSVSSNKKRFPLEASFNPISYKSRIYYLS